MIVLDEQLCHEPMRESLKRWYKGKIAFIKDVRPSSVIKDDAMPALLLRIKQPTFLTLNYKDFWRKIKAHRGYCVICIALESEAWPKAAPILRELFRLPEFHTKSARMGKVISWRDGNIRYYEK